MRSKTALATVFIGVFALCIPLTGIVADFTNALLSIQTGGFAVAFVYDNIYQE